LGAPNDKIADHLAQSICLTIYCSFAAASSEASARRSLKRIDIHDRSFGNEFQIATIPLCWTIPPQSDHLGRKKL
jgi:hypothetical protein